MFALHPSDIRRRRHRCEPLFTPVQELQHEFVSDCNACNSRSMVVLAPIDRYGFPVRTVMCLECGLVYLLDRLTRDSYARFYRDGHYRALVSAFTGQPRTPLLIQSNQRTYSRNLIAALQGFIGDGSERRLLDVGGSTGIVAKTFQRELGFAATVLDPCEVELAAAAALGVRTATGCIETWETDLRFDLILLCRTIEHLSDLNGSLRRIRRLLAPGGLFYCDIVDFLEICRREGPVAVSSRLDHCFWLTQETAASIFGTLGFGIVSTHVTWYPDQVGFLLTPERARPHSISRDWVDRQVRRLRELDADWQDYERTSMTMWDRVRSKAYRIKRHVSRWRGVEDIQPPNSAAMSLPSSARSSILCI